MKKFGIIYLFFLLMAFHLNAQEQKYKAITFDFGGVIAAPNKQVMIDFVSSAFGMSKEEAITILKAYRNSKLHHMSDDEFWQTYADEYALTLPENWINKWHQAIMKSMQDVPGMIELVKSLQAQGYMTPMLSNISKQYAAIINDIGYYDLFHPVLLSYQLGIEKPDLRIYKILLLAVNLPAEQVIFIDDLLENVEAAKALGIDAIQFFSTEQLIQELGSRGIYTRPAHYLSR